MLTGLTLVLHFIYKKDSDTLYIGTLIFDLYLLEIIRQLIL